MLIDNHGRKIEYMRLAVTDRCNLRCFYCMPEEGINYIDRKDLLSFEEMHRLVKIFSSEGVQKIRITGGEPFVRKGIDDFIASIIDLPDVQEVNITTNGTLTNQHLHFIQNSGIKNVNLSLDTLNKQRFFAITRRDKFDEVYRTYESLRDSEVNLKLNMVVMQGRNIEDIYPMIDLAKNHAVSVRFIEEMPFNGTPGQGNESHWPAHKILSHIRERYPIQKLKDDFSSTSQNYQVEGYSGTFGIIAAYTRSFCGSCNRIRLTPQGELRTCLYGKGVVSFRDLLRSGATDQEVKDTLINAVAHRAKDGFVAEKLAKENDNPSRESMATIGG